MEERLLSELQKIKTDEEAKEFIQKNITQQNVKENKEFISVSCEKIFLQTTLLLLSLTTTFNNKEYPNLPANPNAIHALFLSLKFNFYQLFDLLIDKGFSLNLQRNKKQTIIEYAIEIGNHNAVRYLLIDNKKTSHFFATKGKCTLFNAFFTSISLNDIFHVQFFLDQLQVDVNSQNKTGRNALHVCAINNQIGIAKTLILRGIDLYHIDRENRNALHLSLYYKHFEFAKYLMKETPININSFDNKGNNSLLYCVITHRLKPEKYKPLSDDLKNEIFSFTKYFIEETKVDLTINIQNRNGDGNNLLLLSVIGNHFDLVKYLIEEKKMDIQVTNKRLFNALFLGIKENVNEDILEYLFDKGVNFKTPIVQGSNNILLYSIRFNKPNFVKFIVEKELKEFEKLETVLEKTIEKAGNKEFQELAKFLISKGVNVNYLDVMKRSALDKATTFYHFEFARYLADLKEVDVNHLDKYNRNIIHNIAMISSLFRDAFPLAKYLIEERGANENIFDLYQKTPAHLAITSQNVHFAKYLIEERKIPLHTTINNPSSYYESILHTAARYSLTQLQFFKYLIEEKKMDVNEVKADGNSILSIVVANGDFNTARYLIDEIGMDVKLHDNDKCNLLFLATRHKNNLEFLRYLIEEKKMNYHQIYNGNNLFLEATSQIATVTIELLNYLKDLGIDIHFIDEQGRTSTSFYIWSANQFHILKYLVKLGVDLDARIYHRETALVHILNYYKNAKLIRLFVDNGCKLHNLNFANENALECVERERKDQQFKSFFKSYLLLKGLEKCFVPHTHITLPFSHHNLSDWKSLFISTLNYSPLIYQKKK